MKFLTSKLIHLPVETDLGVKVGTVQDIIFSTEDYSFIQMVVKQSVLSSLFSEPLLISFSQIISITEEKVIIKDVAIKQAQIAQSIA